MLLVSGGLTQAGAAPDAPDPGLGGTLRQIRTHRTAPFGVRALSAMRPTAGRSGRTHPAEPPTHNHYSPLLDCDTFSSSVDM